MGKSVHRRLPVAQQHTHGSASPTTSLCRRCSMNFFDFNCLVVLVLSVAAFLSAIFWVLPNRYGEAGFDADESMKLSATVQAHFKLQRLASELVPYIPRLEYDINEEIGVHFFKVAVLSMHQAGVSNRTNVLFGFCSNVSNNPISPVSLSVLKSSLVDLFLQQYNMTLTYSIFGETSSFEILKFPGGISIMLGQAAMFLRTPQVLFNFTLNSSICEIRKNLLELKEQLRIGLQLVPTEAVFIQATNKCGSTQDPAVTIEASVVSDMGSMQPERLKQLAQRITESPSIENLGLDHTVFGKVKEISLSSFLNHSLYAPTPTPSPSPAPSTEQIYNSSPSLSPSRSPVLSPGRNCHSSVPSDASLPPAPSSNNAPCVSLSTPNSPSPSIDPSSISPDSTYLPSHPTSHPNQFFPSLSPHAYSEPPLATPESYLSPSVSPLPSGSYATRGSDKWSVESLVSPPHFSSSFASSMSCTMWRRIWCFYLTGVSTLFLALWTS
ncbi:uncharacterized protein [Henckelia pumila]|uniref:uncharacterized protein isoform X2 n=1 Tax=Henckelia pumila TaxID=405737 RepID=UPI003C6E73F0